MNIKKELVKLIEDALTAYGMENASYELIRHNENITCKVKHENKNYSLRIHQPIDGFDTSIVTNGRRETELFQSEVNLLLYMNSNGFEGLQQPIKNTQGEYVKILDDGIPAMLLTWVEGEPIKQEVGSKYAEAIGELACKIHNASKGFSEDRIQYDNELCDRMINEIANAVSLKHLSEEVGKICIRELGAIKKAQIRMINEDGCSPLHADMGFGNILVTENGLIPIDFSLSGYGCVAQEAGMIMSNFHDDESCREVLNGFVKGGSIIEMKDAEIFISYSVLLFICAQHNKVYKEDWFTGALERWSKELFVHD